MNRFFFQLYKKPIFDKNAYKILYYKSHKTTFDGRQLAALKLLYSWRDKVAREEDESTRYKNFKLKFNCAFFFVSKVMFFRI